MQYTIRRDGSYDICAGSICLTGCYPSVNGIPVRPVSVVIAQNEIHYELLDGSLTLRFDASSSGLCIHCHVVGFEGAHDIAPLAAADVEGGERLFKQGFGLGGPSGFCGIDETADSDALIALGGSSGCMTLHAVDHSKYRIRYRMENKRLSATIDVECTLSGAAELPVIHIRTGEDFSSALKQCATEIADAMHAVKRDRPAFHWCSWYYLYHNLTQARLEEYLDGFSRCRDIAPFTHIQIDAGYFPSCGDWLEPMERYPGGLKLAAETIRAAGYEPGIWVGPFMVGDESKLFREHPDWMLRYNDGSLVTCWNQYNEPKPWGYPDSDYYVLDTSHPDAMDYLYNVFSTLRSWGYTLYKTDFLFWGMHDSAKVRRHTPGKTSFEYYRDAMATIRRAIGEDSAWLGCIAPFMPSVGFVDMMRIGGDVGAQWEKDGFGPTNMIREILADQYFNNVYWQNDPDAVLLRDFHIHLKPHQIEALALLQALSGGVITTSEPIHAIAPDRQRLLALIHPDGFVQPEYPYWPEDREEKVLAVKLAQGSLAYFFNPTGRDLTVPCDWKRLLGDDAWHLLRLHGESAPATQVPCVTVPAQSGVLFFASREPLEREPKNLWIW